MTGSLADAEDLAQETFIRAYEQIGSFNGRAKFSTWLYRIAVQRLPELAADEARRFQAHSRLRRGTVARDRPGREIPPPETKWPSEAQAAC